MKTLHPLLALMLLPGTLNCAGPTTPLGAVWDLTPQKTEPLAEPDEPEPQPQKTSEAQITFLPRHQILHAKRDLKVVIEDPDGVITGKKSLFVYYNGRNVTRSFFLQTDQKKSDLTWSLTLPSVWLKPGALEHRIVFAYKSHIGKWIKASYQPPTCMLSESNAVVNPYPFHPPKRILEMIELIAKNKKLNPAFATALIAQESSFSSKKVSWAKAIGLTQVTPLADEELRKNSSAWPRYPRINEMSVAFLIALIRDGEINARNEWRLDPKLSIEGGLTYARMLSDRWSMPENYNRIRSISKTPDIELTKLVLASYNAGYSRVHASLREGDRWLSSDDLTEARKYVNLIFSFCDQFADNSEDPL